VPPPRRRPATPPPRRPKVAGLHRRLEHDQPEDQPVSGTLEATGNAENAENAENTARTESTARTDGTVAAGPVESVIAEQPELEPEPAPRRRRPTPKRRDEGTAVGAVAADTLVEEPAPLSRDAGPVAEPEDLEPEPEAGAEDTFEDDAERAPNYTLPIALLVVALLLGGLAYWFAQQLSDARVGGGNDALSDVNATKDLVGAAQQSVAGVLSYKFDDMAGSTARAKQFLDGEAVGQYEASMKALEKEIQDQKLQVVVNPVSIGVVRLAGDDARVLVFADQIGARADNQPSGGPTQFAMDMHRTNGKWKVVKLDFFETR
jgi:Mce-associated membrane protein